VSRVPAPVRSVVAAAVTVLAVLAAAGCDGGPIGQDTPQSDGQSFVGSSYSSTFYPVGHRPDAPAVSGTTVSGQHLSLAAYRGHTIVLNFWGSWCAPCRAEAAALGTLARKLQPSGVQFVGIDIRDQPDSAVAFMQTFRIDYPSINDPDDEIALAFRNTVPPAAIPTTLIIDRQGQIAARIVGESSYDQLAALIAKVTGQQT
jgi:thiol-disulfide isomerase/thioredoxin